MSRPPRHSDAVTIRALTRARGEVAEAARILGVSRQSLHKRIARTPALADALARIVAAQPARLCPTCAKPIARVVEAPAGWAPRSVKTSH